MSFICSIRLKTAIHQLMLSFDTVFMCKIGVNYQYVSRDTCTYEHVFCFLFFFLCVCFFFFFFFFKKRLVCAVIGACALIRTNMVVNIVIRSCGFQQSYNVSNQR